jgi:hypothetical protein
MIIAYYGKGFQSLRGNLKGGAQPPAPKIMKNRLCMLAFTMEMVGV